MRSNAKIHVWNRALGRVGESRLEDPDNLAIKAARVCADVWDDVLEAVLEEHPWRFARRQAALTELEDESRTGWEYCYALPDDCVTPLDLLDEGQRRSLLAEADRAVFDIMDAADGASKILVTDLEPDDFDVLEYTGRHTGVASWPRAFIEAVAWRLAAQLAFDLKHEPSLAGQLMKVYDDAVTAAVAVELNGIQQDQQPLSPSLAAR